MPRLPRIAVGAVEHDADDRPMRWALMDALEQYGSQLQVFLSQAHFDPLSGADSITGQGPRYLDSWLMSPDVCREIFLRGMRSSDLAMVVGSFAPAGKEADRLGGSLDRLCDWLDLPRVVVLDVSPLDRCRLPARPARVDAVLLDRIRDRNEFLRVKTRLEPLWGAPVVGALPPLPAIRSAVADLPSGGRPPSGLCRALGTALRGYLKRDRLLDIAVRTDLPDPPPRLFREQACAAGPNVAVAYDEAFHRYFPDALEMLELRGAAVRDFSPLRDEHLPDETDLVYIGCGRPEQMAEALADNHCMLLALRRHVSRGGRVYGEGGGLAYLSRHMVLADGRTLPMVGALPTVAFHNPRAATARPAALTVARDNWLAEASSRLRGYLNGNWRIRPTGPLVGYGLEPSRRYDLVGRAGVIGSRLHLNFTAQPQILRTFLRPLAPTSTERQRAAR